MMRPEIFKKLFNVIEDDNAESLWHEIIIDYLNVGGDLLVQNPDNGWSFLHYAAENLFSHLTLMLLNKGLPVDVRDLNGSTPYLVALDASIDSAIQNELPAIDFSVVKVLIDNGANVDVCSSDGISRASLLENYGEQASEEYSASFF